MSNTYEIKCPVCMTKRDDATSGQLETGVTYRCMSCATEFTVDNENQHILENHFDNKRTQ